MELRQNSLKIISLGGFGQVTKNMFLYETAEDLLIVDCGIGFPEEGMLGVDLVVPDISYLGNKKNKIRAIILSHGHDDHIGGLPYILPQLPNNLPVFAPKWAAALSRLKLEEFGLPVNLREIDEKSQLNLGRFTVEFIRVTHSIPDTFHLVIKTPVGVIYHAADFKLDLTPVMGKPTSQERIIEVGKRGVLCLLSDCLRAENPGFTPPEAKLEEMFEKEMTTCSGKFFVTTMSSNISRLKQAIEVSRRHQRKVVLVGKSVEKNLELAEKLKYLQYPRDVFVERKEVGNYSPASLTLLVAGSQGQTGSALDRIVAGGLKNIKIEAGDKVIFSTDYIPGNETAIYNLIDNVYRLGGEVVYQDIHSGVHVSGHGSQKDLSKLMEMVRPRWLVPIGGNFRHMAAYQNLAQSLGFKKEQVVLADGGEVIDLDARGDAQITQKIEARQVMIDALGVGDVGNVFLRDRQILATEGIVVAIIALDQTSHVLEGDPEIVTRGFAHIEENKQLLDQTKERIRQAVRETRGKRLDFRLVRRQIQEELEKFFFKKTGHRPMILPIIIEV